MATLKEVAERAGITVTTVSRVLNNRGYISEKTRKRVYEVMEELHYQPNEIARSLTKKRTNAIGLIVPSARHPFFASIIHYMEYYAMQHKSKIFLCIARQKRELEQAYLDILRSNQVSGVISCARMVDIEHYHKLNMPVVLVENMADESDYSVCCDNYQGGDLATKYLIACGCKKLMMILGVAPQPLPADSRSQAFIDACEKYGVEYKIASTSESQFLKMDYGSDMERLIQEYEGVDGIFASSDVIAARVIQACAKLGIRIPEQLQIVGFDDVPIASLTTPQITTIRQPVAQMCSHAVTSIFQQLEGRDSPHSIVLPVSLVKRETTRNNKKIIENGIVQDM